MKVLPDVTPLRESKQFRWLYFGAATAEMGNQLSVVALPVHIYLLTGSSLYVGAVSVAQVVPLIIGSLIGGTIADAVDRRKLLLVLQLALAVALGLLAVNSMLPEPPLWPVFVIAVLIGLLTGAEGPARKATIPMLVTRDQLTSAFALVQVVRRIASGVGPAVGGVIIVAAGPQAAFTINALTFLVATVAVWKLRPLPAADGARKPGFAALAEGFVFLRRRPVLMTNFVVDLNAMIFAMPRALFPEIGFVLLAGDATTVGYLYAAPGIGSLIGALTSGWVGGIRKQGRAVTLSMGVWGLAVIALGFSQNVVVAVAALVLAGAADVVAGIFRSTILQLATPDELRGRLSAVHTAVVTAGPRIGDAQASAVGSLVGAPIAVVGGGVACLIGLVVLARKVPSYWNYDIHDPVPEHGDDELPRGTPRPEPTP